MTYFSKSQNAEGDYYYPNKNLAIQKSNHYVLGYSKVFKSDIRFLIEAYYQDLWDLPVAADSTKTWSPINDEFIGFACVSEGRGKNYGIELTLEKFFTNNYYFIITHSLFNAKYQPLNGKWYNTRYNNNYITNFVGGKEYQFGDNILGINARFIWSGGRRATPLTKESLEGMGIFDVFDQTRTNELKLAPYLRLDIGVNFKFNLPEVSHEIAVDIQNVTHRENEGGLFPNLETGEQISYTLQGILPMVSYRLYF